MIFHAKKLIAIWILSIAIHSQCIASDQSSQTNVLQKIDTISLTNPTNLATLRILYTLQSLSFSALLTYTIFTDPSISPYENSFRVDELYPHAQDWYNAIHAKYPQAHLDEKIFKIAPAHHSFESSITDILFPIKAIQDLNEIYKKQNNGDTLEEFETLFLYRLEFLLLHEAAHIEHNDLAKRTVSPIFMYMITETCAQYWLTSSFHADNIKWIQEYIDSKNLLSSINPTASIVAIGLYLSHIANITNNSFVHLCNVPYIRRQEQQADDFALEHGDINVLQGALQFFELIDVIETISKNPEHPDYETAVFFKQHPTWRWLFDTLADKNHPQPSIRAHKFQQELERRLHNQEQA